MILIDTVMYLVIAWYVDAVFPGTYGVPRPWHFFLHLSYWIPSSPPSSPPSSSYAPVPTNDSASSALDLDTARGGDIIAETDSGPRIVGIRLAHLSKVSWHLWNCCLLQTYKHIDVLT
jgi:hypothetical protein